MFYTIYKTTNKIDGKVYIGKHQTKDLEDGYMGSGKYLKNAIQKYGIENFTKEILHVFESEQEMNSKEAELVTEEFCDRSDTYNLCPGGHGGFGYINNSGVAVDLNQQRENDPTLARRAAIAGNLRKKILWETDDEWRQKYSDAISKANVGNTNWLGKSHSDETKAKIGAANSKHQTGSGNSQYGTIWITDGSANRKIKKSELIPDGWWRGRTTIAK